MMTYEELKTFILDHNRMKMSHIYKPAMVRCVLANGGAASLDQIAAEFIQRDVLQLEHYRRNVVDKMPGQRMVRDGVLVKDGGTYRMAPPFDELTRSQQLELMAACERRIEEFVASRGDPFPRNNTDPVPGSVRYEVLKRAGGRCELCGVSHEEVPLDVDHIVPRTKGGTNDPSNLQALCRTCNSQKLNRDDTDFRAVADAFAERDPDCVFCQQGEQRSIASNELAIAILDKYPVTEGHTLIIPRRHVADYFELYQSERNAMDQLLRERKARVQYEDNTVCGFNVGANAGEAAGQTIFHVHIHLIPRRPLDTKDPRGGVRGVIPERQRY
jgi:diadenosine tetraphosphate (Ap4A) HIT family hydrolase